ncbi:B3 domain-containing protein REM5 [Euphorbia peplus]|nr:B3 domain-containing protein REM5 [Euphorbia peplus]
MSSTLIPKPHFFKPLLPGFHDDFVIPAAFSKYLKEQKYEKAMLGTRKGGKLWPVKIYGRRFEDGWKEFVEAHGFQIGDFLVFRHEGDLVFYVLVFDRTTCEREYQCSPCFTAADVEVKIEVDDQEQEQEQEQEENLPEGSTCGEKLEEKNEVEASPEAKPSSFVFEYPYTVVQLNPKSIKKSRLHIPRKFARDHGLCGRCCSVILKNEEGNCWPANLLHKTSTGKTYIAGGWTSFRVARTLTAEDSLIIELTRNGKIPVLKIQRLQAHPEIKQEIMNENRAEADSSSPVHLHATTGTSNLENSRLQIPEEVAKQSGWKKLEKKKKVKTEFVANACSSALKNPSCIIELIRDSFKSARVYIPRRFAREHDLYGRCCSMILKDGEGNCWPARLIHKSSNGKTYIAGAWKSFRLAHKLKPGDSLLVELARNGNIPVLKMQKVQEPPEVKEEVMSEADSLSPEHLHATTGASNLEKSHPKIPEEIAKAQKNKQPENAEARIQQRFFVAKINDSCFDSKLFIPGKFARLHFQQNNYCEVILINREGISWPAILRHKDRDDQAYIGDGWNEFRVANYLKPGDSVVFEFIQKGKSPALKIYEFRTNHNARMNEDDTASSLIEKPCFYVTVKSSDVREGQIKIPADFAWRNGLVTSLCSEMTIKNETGKSWQVHTKVNTEVFIRYGWSEFAEANGIKVGDVFMLELIKEEGKMPLMNYYAAK